MFIPITSYCQDGDQSTVYGKIINYNELTDDVSIKIISTNYFSQTSFSVNDFINSDGTFKLEFMMLCPHDVLLIFGEDYFQIICSPGKSLYLEILEAGERNTNRSIRFKNSKINDDLYAWNTALKKEIRS